jgi:seryl-tRNA synthetase
MLQISFIRQNTELVKERLSIKHFGDLSLVDKVVELDEHVRKLKVESETLQADMNAASKAIGLLMSKGEKEAAEQKKQAVTLHKSAMQQLHDQLAIAEKQLYEAMVKFPNLPHTSVPKGNSPEENQVVREGGTKPALPENAVPHWDLIKKYDLVDFEAGAKITGSGFPLYKGKGAKLQRALIQYFLDYNIAAGYTEYLPPLMVNEESAFGTGSLPDKEGQMYHVTEDDLYLIPTSEVPVTNIYRDEIVKESSVPVKMTSYTPCFRREAGSFGSHVRGLNRVHQFDKVEIIQLTHPEKSYEVQEDMVQHIETLLNALQLPYRILRLCGGDMTFAGALTYDFEVFSAAQQKWLEVSSVTNFETFQTNRMKIRYKNAEGKTQLLHSLNGSSLALPRIVACLLENNQTETGIKLPEVLHSYFGNTAIS